MQGTVRDVVGLYLNPPDKVLVLAWDRVPRRLARKQSQDWAFTAEGKPTGLTGWWRALEEVERTVVGDSRKRVREQGFLRSEEHTSELQSRPHLVCRLLLEK